MPLQPKICVLAPRKPVATVPASTPFRSVLRQAAMFEKKTESQSSSKPSVSPLNKPKNLNISPSNPTTTANVAVVAVAPPAATEVSANVAITPSAIAGRGHGSKLPSIVVVPTDVLQESKDKDTKGASTIANAKQTVTTNGRPLKESPDSRRRDSSGASGADKGGGRSSGSAAASTTKDSGFFSHFKSIRASFQELLPGGSNKNSAGNTDHNNEGTTKFSKYSSNKATTDKTTNRTTTPDSTAPTSTGE